jgi:NAD(P)-dependent dehydrogenase (short-subunit alcohol dehydrogenase family)
MTEEVMARRSTTMPVITGGGSGIGRRVVTALVVLVLLALVLREPVGAAHAVQRLAGWAGDVVDALGTFGSALSRTS